MRKFLHSTIAMALLLLLLSTAIGLPIAQAESTYKPSEARYVLRVCAGLEAMNESVINYDLDKDKIITITDARIILRLSAGLSPTVDTYETTAETTIGLMYIGRFRATAYCPCYSCSEGWGRRTASGAIARANHTIAVDRRIIPLGTDVVINGRAYRAEDVGGGVKGNSIDVFFDTHAETRQWGVRYVEVYKVVN